MLKAFVVVALLFAVVTARPSGKIFLPCKNYKDKYITVTDVSVPNCSQDPCVLKRGSTNNVTVTFNTIAVPSDGSLKVSYVQMCGEVTKSLCPNLGLSDADVCDLGAKCPLNKGDVNTIVLSVPISSSYPPLTILADFYFEEKAGDTDRSHSIGCAQLDVKLE